MTMNATPRYPANPNLGTGVISVANTGRDGTGTLVDCFTASSKEGSSIKRITIVAQGTTTGGMIRLYINDGGSNTRLWKEVPVTAITPSATLPAWTVVIEMYDIEALQLLPSYKIKAAPHNAETFNVFVEGADY